MLTQEQILQRSEAYACCALSYMAQAVRHWDRGDQECGDDAFEKAKWLGLFAAPLMYDASMDGTCETPALATEVAQAADCICNPCECATDVVDCTIVADYIVDGAVAYSALPSSPADGATYYILSGTNAGYIATWSETGGFDDGFSNGFDI